LNRGGKTIIMVTHENDIAAWARRVVRMRDGHIESDVRNEGALPDGSPRDQTDRTGITGPDLFPYQVWPPSASEQP
jgi:energy-coupling factor transporter ATP-binding protein EcfA2